MRHVAAPTPGATRAAATASEGRPLADDPDHLVEPVHELSRAGDAHVEDEGVREPVHPDAFDVAHRHGAVPEEDAGDVVGFDVVLVGRGPSGAPGSRPYGSTSVRTASTWATT